MSLKATKIRLDLDIPRNKWLIRNILLLNPKIDFGYFI
jgi:hypothetical protein